MQVNEVIMMKRTAFMLQVHKNPNQINSFIQQLIQNGAADVYVHIDKKHYRPLSEKIIKHPNVVVLREAAEIHWGDISQVDATLMLLQEVVRSGREYDFVCLRSGQDLLVKNGFKQFLENGSDQILMTAQFIDRKRADAALPCSAWPAFMRRQRPYYDPGRMLRLLTIRLYGKGIRLFPKKRALPDKYSLYHGSAWFCMPLEAVRYILRFLEENRWYYEFFQDALCPDEWFFQTIMMNSPFKSKVVNNNQTYLIWGTSRKERNSPIVLKMSDIDLIQNSGRFFARKFDENVDPQIIDYFRESVSM
jgi:hypothetical protein